jgi:sugar phosphate permease
MSRGIRTAVVAWLVTAVYYFYQYTLRSAPAVMMPQLADAFGLTAMGVASMVGLFYWGYSPFSLVAGAAMDGLGPRRVVPIGAAVGVGCCVARPGPGHVGRFLRALAASSPDRRRLHLTKASRRHGCDLIGAMQMFGMAAAPGQFVVGPMIAGGVPWSRFWLGMGVAGLVIGALLYALIPGAEKAAGKSDWLRSAARAMRTVFLNPQSLLCGFIAGLLFIPTTIFDMVWGVRYLQEARGLDYGTAVMRSAAVPLGWMIGCPLLGFVSDRLGRRKPVIAGAALVLLGCLAWILYGPANVLPPYVLALVAGIASGAAILPYTVIKEANPPQYSGTATGVVNFLNFTFSALLGPVFAGLLRSASGGAETMALEHYQAAFVPLLYGVALALVLTLVLKETGPAACREAPAAARKGA